MSLDTQPAPRVAVYISGGIGDVLLHLGFVKALADHFQQPVDLILATPPATNGLLASQPYVGRVVNVPSTPGAYRDRVAAMLALLQPLGLDTLFFFGFQRSVLRAAVMAGIVNRVGYVRLHRFYQARLMSQAILVRRKGTPHPDTHTWLPRLFAKYGYPVAPASPALVSSDDARRLAAPLVAGYPKLIGLGLGAAAARRRYGAAQMADVMQRLASHDHDVSFLLFGGNDVVDLAADMRRRVGDSVRVLDVTASNMDLLVGQALVAHCMAFAGNDSMGIHLAVASGVPSVGLFGVSPPMAYSPLLLPLQATRAGGMDGIVPTDVVDAVLKQLRDHGQHDPERAE